MSDEMTVVPSWWRPIGGETWECRFISSDGQRMRTRLTDAMVRDQELDAFLYAEDRVHRKFCEGAGRPVALYVRIREARDGTANDIEKDTET